MTTKPADTEATTTFVVLEGMQNPSKPDEIGWRDWDRFATQAEAVRAARELPLAMVESRRVAAIYRNGTRIK